MTLSDQIEVVNALFTLDKEVTIGEYRMIKMCVEGIEDETTMTDLRQIVEYVRAEVSEDKAIENSLQAKALRMAMDMKQARELREHIEKQTEARLRYLKTPPDSKKQAS